MENRPNFIVFSVSRRRCFWSSFCAFPKVPNKKADSDKEGRTGHQVMREKLETRASYMNANFTRIAAWPVARFVFSNRRSTHLVRYKVSIVPRVNP